MKLGSPPNSFHKNMSHKQLHFTWSTFCDSSMGTKLKYFWLTYETGNSAWYFDKNISHEQILFTRSTFRDSSVGTKLEYIWKTDENVKFARIFSQKHISRTNTFNTFAALWFLGISEKKHIKSLVFTQEYLRSCWAYGPGRSVNKRSKSSNLHSKKKFLPRGWVFLWVTSQVEDF